MRRVLACTKEYRSQLPAPSNARLGEDVQRDERTVDPPQQLPRDPRARERDAAHAPHAAADRKSTRLNSSHVAISYAVFCLKKKKTPRAGKGTAVRYTPSSRTSRPRYRADPLALTVRPLKIHSPLNYEP